MTSSSPYEEFLSLHRLPHAFVMPNAWDGLSALILKQQGFRALGTSSAALAATMGRIDGSHTVSAREHIAHARLLATISALPVNGDFEDGYGRTPDDVAATVSAAVEAGLAGIGIEDTTGDPSSPIRSFDDAVARMRSSAAAARGRIVLTGRTDNFLQGNPDLDDTVRRLTAFAEEGADVLYAPGLPDVAALTRVIAAVAPRPVSVVVGTAAETLTVEELSSLGVKRISTGPALYRHAASALQRSAETLAAGNIAAATSGMSHREMTAIIRTGHA
ncbi:isocitrate lyase/phosphoenolpyruvate mutase family protein [Mycolicibacterium sp. 018/SC-01/001]|uniref:isocitrate lyase/PEP mutase family protein n=1 Tax=Mycolicibacterium sp. 018/SC-01/001 TaxID=2592069 RepID=UPI00117FF395|nr:isocitrate lyase/phosphoenolpyruvate mutase family protein [Mycolicibacterium sp. 018/SC-01/001]TRW79868.1 isocitrate lyase/phosphoenolpyruvate mutase family protein [Mycolicibacterium sp. 018/SC-01/001]